MTALGALASGRRIGSRSTTPRRGGRAGTRREPCTGYTYARIQPPLTGPGYSCSPALDNYTADNLANLQLAGKAAVDSDACARAREALAARRAAMARR